MFLQGKHLFPGLWASDILGPGMTQCSSSSLTPWAPLGGRGWVTRKQQETTEPGSLPVLPFKGDVPGVQGSAEDGRGQPSLHLLVLWHHGVQGQPLDLLADLKAFGCHHFVIVINLNQLSPVPGIWKAKWEGLVKGLGFLPPHHPWNSGTSHLPL